LRKVAEEGCVRWLMVVDKIGDAFDGDEREAVLAAYD
jgi:hypothetical protein